MPYRTTQSSESRFDGLCDEISLWQAWLAFVEKELDATSSLYGFVPTVHSLERLAVTRALVVIHNHPASNMERYNAARLLDEDACTLRLVQDEPWFLWENALDWPGVTDAQRARYALDAQDNMNVGVSIRLTFFDGRGLGGIGIAAQRSTATEFREKWKQKQELVISAAREFDAAMRPRMIANRFKLSPREKEIVSLLAGGLSAKEVAFKLGIKPKTVFNTTDHVRKAMQAANTLEAVTKALAFRLI